MGDDAQALTLTTADGIRLRAVLEVPDGPVDATAVVAHPHPLYGGDQDNPVVTTVARTLR
jgi:alpha/beta superfamily hydrolase